MFIFAYLDPGTGGLIIQAVLGGVAGIALFFRSRLGRLRRKSPLSSANQQDSSGADAKTGPDLSSDA